MDADAHRALVEVAQRRDAGQPLVADLGRLFAYRGHLPQGEQAQQENDKADQAEAQR